MPPRRPNKIGDAPNQNPAAAPTAETTNTTAAAEDPEPVLHSHSLTVPLPDQPGACNFIVEFPGYIKNEDRALATFGGLDGLAAQRQTHPKTLQLRLRPGDPSCHPLISDDAKSTTVLVLKLTRSKQPTKIPQTDDLDLDSDDEDSIHNDGGVKAAIIAVADKTYAFSAPADFQYAGQDRRPLEVQWISRPDRVEDDPEFLPRQPLLCTPSMFAVEPAVDYAFKQYKAAEHGLDVLGRKPKRGTGITWVDYFAKEVPGALETNRTIVGGGTPADNDGDDGNDNNDGTTATAGPSQNAGDGDGGARGSGAHGGHKAAINIPPGMEALFARLETLFTRRPVYLESALGAALGTLDGGGGGGGGSGATAAAGTSSSSFAVARSQQELLSKLCYRFKNGPWKGTWVLRGYDPRAEPAARQYQVLEYSLPVEWWKKVLTHKNRLNKQQQQFQYTHSSTTTSNGGLSTASAPAGLPPIAASYTALCSFNGVQSTQTLQLQLCDIDDSEVRSVLAETSNVAAGVSDASGWLTQPAWEGIKSKVATRFGSLWETATTKASSGGTGNAGDINTTGCFTSIGIIPAELMSSLASYLERGHHGKTTGAGAKSGGGGGRPQNATTTSDVANEEVAATVPGQSTEEAEDIGGTNGGTVNAQLEGIQIMEEDEEEEEEEEVEEDEEDDDDDIQEDDDE